MAGFYATGGGEPRERRASDLVLLVLATGALGLVAAATRPGAVFADAFGSAAEGSPAYLESTWKLGLALATIWPLTLVVAALAARRIWLARDLVAAGIAALGASIAGAWLLDGGILGLADWIRSEGPPVVDPAMRLAVPAAVIITAAPHLTQPLRRLGHWNLAVLTGAGVALRFTTPAGAVMGLLIAVIGATVVHLLFGSSAGRPTTTAVGAWLDELGVPVTSLTRSERGAPGVLVLDAVADDGRPLVVKVLGRDAADGRLLAMLGRRLWYRDPGSPAPLGRLRQVEHEALLTLLASQAGIATESVVRVGLTATGSAVIVTAPIGTWLADADPDSGTVPPGLAEDLWGTLARLHGAGLAHGQVDVRHLVTTDEGIALIDFRGGSAVAEQAQMMGDRVQALITLALLMGPDRAAESAIAALGGEAVLDLLAYLQRSALTVHQRHQVKDADLDLDEFRGRIAEQLDAEAPELVRLQRVTWGMLLQTALFVLAFWFLVVGVGSLDLEELKDSLSTASWGWVAAGFVVAQLPRFAQAIATLGASPVPLPVGPVYALQLAVSYVNLAVPTTAARVAVNVRFFQRHGLAPGAAVAIGALDGFSGFVVQLILFPTLLLLTPTSIDWSRLDAPSINTDEVLRWVLLAGIVLALAYVLTGRWRRKVIGWIRRTLAEGRSAFRGLGSLRRIGLLLGGNLANELLFAAALGCCVRALGYSVPLGTLILINITVGLFAGLLPIPGGIGVFEAGITLGLTMAGVPEATAFAAVMLYRLASFYLPPIWGFFALRWLQRNQHI